MLARLFRDLAPFQPTLVGTYPLGLQVDGSDLDVVCTCADLDAFTHSLRTILADLDLRATIDRLPLPAVVASLTLADIDVEIFAQTLPIAAQAGFRHLTIEARLLTLGGPDLHTRIHALKRSGMKTEPAFAHALGLPGDPYAALLELETRSTADLRQLIERSDTAITITTHTGDRTPLLPLFRLADDSESEIASYRDRGTVLVATADGQLVGHVQMIAVDATTWELKSLAVLATHRHHGLGRRLVDAGLAHAHAHGSARVLLATGAADTALLRFYQRAGFRLLRVERDAFTPAAGYPPDLHVDGIRLLDRVWLDTTGEPGSAA
jgi:ribosomal protein S18 acetylase RimI-like enzyme